MERITKEDIRIRYKEYNQLYFGNQLKHCKFSVQKQSPLGTYTSKKEKDGTIPLGTYTSKKEKDGTITGHIWIAYDVDWTEETLREVIIHEMIHHYVKTIDKRFSGLFGHGYPFLRQCRRLKRDYGLNITVLSAIPHINQKPETATQKFLAKFFSFLSYV